MLSAKLRFAPASMAWEDSRETEFREEGSQTEFWNQGKPLQRYGVTAVFHGHAHRGTHEGKTSGGIPVYNVALPLMKRQWPDRPPCRILEIPIGNIKEEISGEKAERPS